MAEDGAADFLSVLLGPEALLAVAPPPLNLVQVHDEQSHENPDPQKVGPKLHFSYQNPLLRRFALPAHMRAAKAKRKRDAENASIFDRLDHFVDPLVPNLIHKGNLVLRRDPKTGLLKKLEFLVGARGESKLFSIPAILDVGIKSTQMSSQSLAIA